ncbi:MAG TPA: rod shape-determining protein [Candidatus Portnoybacteria bacterium]|jgi:rod shape-determining protein MreB and related proteins|nr:rod shape-determining protein [Candidatus Portnoybacteria bacterium]MDD5752228.1 rod shape-determining protein [Candidatus Portnoybacteria bacterium]HNU96768.1 rod shape-determining protein [Candidatus Portnoybacteria bacterium]HOZ16492.1 rod shape-determining protein [Candidatus Portnoybacteria bacterium]HPH52252.1 rod shape-determining protein [Candidatus Portnoybacteria bacterium]
MFVKKIGIDLGTANTLVYIPEKGVVINEPSVVAIAVDDNKVLAVGNKAKEMIGRTPDSIVASRPLRDGVIADYRVTQAMLSYFINKASGKFRIFRPEVLISVPAGITSTERRAVIEAALQSGAKSAYIAKQPVLAAIGAGVSINSPVGNMIVDIGGGTTDVAIISLGGIVAWSSVRVAGDKIDKAIADYIRRKHNLAIGDRTAEEIKIQIGSAILNSERGSIKIKGRDLIEGLPKIIEITNKEVVDAISGELKEIIRAIKNVLQITPPELASDVMDRGMFISGGGALLSNLDDLITKTTGVPCYIANDPLLCVAKGAGAVLENLEIYKRSIMSKK